LIGLHRFVVIAPITFLVTDISKLANGLYLRNQFCKIDINCWFYGKNNLDISPY